MAAGRKHLPLNRSQRSVLLVRWAILLGFLATPLAAAGDYTDPAGDVVYDVYDTASAPADHDEVDIVNVWIGNETLTTFQIGYETVAPQPMGDFNLFHFRFTFLADGALYEVTQYDTCQVPGAAMRRVENGIAEDRICLDLVMEGNRRTITVNKEDLLNLERAPLALGSTITRFQLEVFRVTGPEATRLLDIAPNAIVDEALVFTIGGNSIGEVQWRIDDAIRYSNGVLGLFETKMHFVNTGAADAVISLSDSPPKNWVSLVPATIVVPAHTALSTPIAFIPPGSHSHGGRTTWPVTATHGQESAHLEIGLDFYTVPQPAGHHPRLWLHGALVPGPGLPGATNEDYWINALENDPNSEPVRISTSRGSPVSGQWEALLRPELLQNIALAPGAGSATVKLYAERPVLSGSATLDIVYCDPTISSSVQTMFFGACPHGAPVPLARGSTDFGQQNGGSFELEFDLPVEETSTIITRANDAFGMGLEVQIAGPWATGDWTPLTLEAPGTHFDLPLIDRAQARNDVQDLGLNVKQWVPSTCPVDGGAHLVEVTNPGKAGTLRWLGMSSLGSRIALPEPSEFGVGQTRRFEIPVGSEKGVHEDFGAILASLDGEAFAWMTWLHVGECPFGMHEDGALGDVGKRSKGTPVVLPVAMLPLLGGALLRRARS